MLNIAYRIPLELVSSPSTSLLNFLFLQSPSMNYTPAIKAFFHFLKGKKPCLALTSLLGMLTSSLPWEVLLTAHTSSHPQPHFRRLLFLLPVYSFLIIALITVVTVPICLPTYLNTINHLLLGICTYLFITYQYELMNSWSRNCNYSLLFIHV